jgi:hypothetical protein
MSSRRCGKRVRAESARFPICARSANPPIDGTGLRAIGAQGASGVIMLCALVRGLESLPGSEESTPALS